MQYHPIPFTDRNVKAILEDRKDQTRRIAHESKISVFLHHHVRSEIPFAGDTFAPPGIHKAYLNPYGAVSVKAVDGKMLGVKPDEFEWVSPYGRIGDRLWVKEAIVVVDRLGGNVKVTYLADDFVAYRELEKPDHARFLMWRRSRQPPMFMPRWAARIFLEITDIRVQRLQEISERDAEREGAQIRDILYPDEPFSAYSYREQFKLGWDVINGKRGYSWDSNPRLWALTFRRIEV